MASFTHHLSLFTHHVSISSMSKPSSEQTPEQETSTIAVMAELFAAIGFEVADERAYNLLVEEAETNGERTTAEREDSALHGRCWKLGEGLEVWSILFERGNDLYYADCRPAFRSRYLHTIAPWELVEYDQEGEAIVRGVVRCAGDVVFELQNLTEVRETVFRKSQLSVALAGITYAARVLRAPAPEHSVHRFELAERVQGFAERACENDYVITGRVLAWREIKNSITSATLAWIYIDCSTVRLEILANTQSLRGQLAIGAEITANIWLQGYVLEESGISARYEGVDRQYEQADFWAGLRRSN